MTEIKLRGSGRTKGTMKMGMLDCWYCDGRGKIHKDREAADKGIYSKCLHCGGMGKLHDDADAGDDQ